MTTEGGAGISHLVLSPTAFSFSAISGGTTPTVKTLSIGNSITTSSNWSASTNQTWCHISPVSGSTNVGGNNNSGNSLTTISVDALSNPGTFNCVITITDSSANNSPQTIPVSYTVSVTTDTQAPSTPTNLNASVISSSQINLSWTASTDNVGVTGYKVYRKTGTNPFTQIATTPTTTYQDTTLTAGTTYSYTVSAYDLAGNNSLQSLAVSATTLVPPPPPPPTTISIGSRIKTTNNVKVRITPTTKGKALCTQPLGVLGTVVGGPTTASGYKWWNVNYDSACDGWSVENYIKPL
jgi:chitodextrinase